MEKIQKQTDMIQYNVKQLLDILNSNNYHPLRKLNLNVESLLDIGRVVGLAAMLQASGTDGAAFRRRTSRQGETRGGLNLLYRPQACIFRLPASAPFTTHAPALASRPDATQPLPPAASSWRHSATPAAAVFFPAAGRTRSRRKAAEP